VWGRKAITVAGSGTQLAVITTEHTLLTVTHEAGVYTFHVDTALMVTGDVLELRVYQKILDGGTLRVAYAMPFYGAPPTDDVIKISVPISTDDIGVAVAELTFTLKQTFGTGRNFPWKVLRHA
jgi:hypothetical protein